MCPANYLSSKQNRFQRRAKKVSSDIDRRDWKDAMTSRSRSRRTPKQYTIYICTHFRKMKTPAYSPRTFEKKHWGQTKGPVKYTTAERQNSRSRNTKENIRWKYSSVFTAEYMSFIPLMGQSPYPSLPHTTVTTKGVKCILQKLNTTKAIVLVQFQLEP